MMRIAADIFSGLCGCFIWQGILQSVMVRKMTSRSGLQSSFQI